MPRRIKPRVADLGTPTPAWAPPRPLTYEELVLCAEQEVDHARRSLLKYIDRQIEQLQDFRLNIERGHSDLSIFDGGTDMVMAKRIELHAALAVLKNITSSDLKACILPAEEAP